MNPPNEKIFQQIPKVMTDLEAIGKNRRNEAQGFKFRGIDDVYNELHSILAKHGVFTVPEVLESTREEKTTRNGGVLTSTVAKIKFTFYADDGSSFFAIVLGEGSDSGDKSCNKSMSVAHKYALIQVFAIPTEDDKDPDFTSYEIAPKEKPPIQIDRPITTDDRKPSEAQLKRLFAISKSSQWTEEELKKYLMAAFNVDSTKKLSLFQYNVLCDSVLKGGAQAAFKTLQEQSVDKLIEDGDPFL